MATKIVFGEQDYRELIPDIHSLMDMVVKRNMADKNDFFSNLRRLDDKLSRNFCFFMFFSNFFKFFYKTFRHY